MVSNILLAILWKSYVHGELTLASETPKDNCNNHVRKAPANLAKEGITSQTFSHQFLENLRECIIRILVTLNGQRIDLVKAFWEPFLDVCFNAITAEAGQPEGGEARGCIKRISEFLSHLGQPSSVCKLWLMVHAVRPLVEKLFPLMKSMVWNDQAFLY